MDGHERVLVVFVVYVKNSENEERQNSGWDRQLMKEASLFYLEISVK